MIKLNESWCENQGKLSIVLDALVNNGIKHMTKLTFRRASQVCKRWNAAFLKCNWDRKLPSLLKRMIEPKLERFIFEVTKIDTTQTRKFILLEDYNLNHNLKPINQRDYEVQMFSRSIRTAIQGHISDDALFRLMIYPMDRYQLLFAADILHKDFYGRVPNTKCTYLRTGQVVEIYGENKFDKMTMGQISEEIKNIKNNALVVQSIKDLETLINEYGLLVVDKSDQKWQYAFLMLIMAIVCGVVGKALRLF